MGTLKTPGTLTADKLASQIEDVEAGGFIFVGCTIKGTFNHLDFATADLPDALFLIPAGQVPPSNALMIWSGQMLIASKATSVHIFRKVAGATLLVTPQSLSSAKANVSSLTPAAMEPAPSMLNRATVVARALSGVGSSTTYTMKDMSSAPLEAERWPEKGMRIDCSGFIAWCLRMPRRVRHPLYQKVNGGWFETTALYRDGMDQTGYFGKVDTARSGSLLVYPDRAGVEGHVGVVIEATGDGIKGVVSVVHCSSGNFRKTGKAIQQTDAKPWRAREDAIIIDYEGF